MSLRPVDLAAMDELILQLLPPQGPPSTIRVDRAPSLLGRAPECDVCLAFSGVSRRHALLTAAPPGQWFIEDLGGANGTRVNGHPLRQPQLLHAGDRIEIGTLRLTVLSPVAPAPPSGPAATTLFSRNAAELQSSWISGAGLAAPVPDSTRIARLSVLVEIAKGLNLAVSIESIFHQAREAVFRHLPGVDRLALLLDLHGDGRLHVVHSAGRTQPPPCDHAGRDTWLSLSICESAFRDRAALQTADAQMDARFDGARSVFANDIHTALAAPLFNDDAVAGVLYADGSRAGSAAPLHAESDLGFFSSLANLIATAVIRWQLARNLHSQELVRQRLERYHSPSVVRQLVQSATAEGLRLEPAESEISVLFADIVGFTELSERLTPRQVSGMLNRFFEEMLDAVFRHHGTLDKFIGDCLMVFFGAPEEQADHAERAVAAAGDMLDRLRQLNAAGAFVTPLSVRIAINTGKAVVGDVGSPTRLEYTALGSTINLASRMESVCPPGECVIGETTRSLLRHPESWEDAGEHRFKGIARPVRVFRAAPADRTV